MVLALLPLAAASQVLPLLERQSDRTARNHRGSFPERTHRHWDSSKGLNEWVAPTSSGGWTCGFYPNTLWQLYNVTGNSTWRDAAKDFTAGIAPQQNNTGTHDVGFMVFYSFGAGIELGAQGDGYRQVVLKAAESLATRYSSRVGCTQSWAAGHHCRLHPDYETRFPVIIDNMMNLELLMWSAANGGPQQHRDMAVSHARKTAQHHVRPDGSTFHVVDYDPESGDVARRCTAQGYLDNTTWTRGQAWCIHGMTMMHRYTGEEDLLGTAVRCADYFINQSGLREDVVPVFDFGWADGGLQYRDASAGAVAAAGLAELSTRVGEPGASRYRRAAEQLVATLTSGTYLGDFDETEGILLHSMDSCAPERSLTGKNCTGSGADVSLVYGGMFLLQAMRRLGQV